MDDFDERIWTCPRCGSRTYCEHLVAFYETSHPWPAGIGCSPIEPDGPIGTDDLAELDAALEDVLGRLWLRDNENPPSAAEARRDLGIPDRLHQILEDEFLHTEFQMYEGEVDLCRDGFAVFDAWRDYLDDILRLAGARQTTTHEVNVPLNSASYIAYWARDAKATSVRVGRQLRADAAALRGAVEVLTAEVA